MFCGFPSMFIGCRWLSMILTDVHLIFRLFFIHLISLIFFYFPLVFVYFLRFPSAPLIFNWFPLIGIGFHNLSSIFVRIQLIFIDFQSFPFSRWFSVILVGFSSVYTNDHWLSSIFIHSRRNSTDFHNCLLPLFEFHVLSVDFYEFSSICIGSHRFH